MKNPLYDRDLDAYPRTRRPRAQDGPIDRESNVDDTDFGGGKPTPRNGRGLFGGLVAGWDGPRLVGVGLMVGFPLSGPVGMASGPVGATAVALAVGLLLFLPLLCVMKQCLRRFSLSVKDNRVTGLELAK